MQRWRSGTIVNSDSFAKKQIMHSVYIKFGSTKNIEDMYENEYLYFSSLNDFRAPIENTGRNDPLEGSLNHLLINAGKISVPGKNFELKINAGHINEYSKNNNGKICSMYTLNVDLSGKKDAIDLRLTELGEKALIFHNWNNFISLLSEACKSDPEILYYGYRAVEYYDKKINYQDLTPYHKENSFQYQNEYRILLCRERTGSFKLFIPGLRQCCAVFDIDLIEKLNITFNEGL